LAVGGYKVNRKLAIVSGGVAVAAVASIAVVVLQVSGGSTATKYASCSELHAAYASGVAFSDVAASLDGDIVEPAVNPSAYETNRHLDDDADEVACELPYVQENPDNWESVAQPLETCKLQETENFFGGGPKGFPAKRWNSALGTVKIAVIPVDFENAPGDGIPGDLYNDDIQKMIEWADYFSRGKMNYDIEFYPSEWIRAPKGAEWYTCTNCQKGSTRDLQTPSEGAQEMISAADNRYNFDGVEIVYFVFPLEAEKNFGTATYGFNEKFTTDEGPMEASIYGEMGGGVGGGYDRSILWDHAVHEMLHFQGFVGHGPSNWTGHYITVDQWGPSKAVTSWEAFLNGWFDEEEILCIESESINQEIYVTLDAIANFGAKHESVMIRLNDEEIIVVERHEEGPFTTVCTDCSSPVEEGFVAYRVNVNSAHFRDDSDPTSDEKNFWTFLGSRTEPTITDSVEFKGVKISLAGRNQVKLEVTPSS
jgi:hypothetical protein